MSINECTPTVPEGDYQINIERTSDADKIGLIIATMPDNTIKIHGLNDEGMVPAWSAGMNTAGTPELMVKEGDFIVAVNGIFVDAEAMKKELAQKTLLITLKRIPAAPEGRVTEAPKQELMLSDKMGRFTQLVHQDVDPQDKYHLAMCACVSCCKDGVFYGNYVDFLPCDLGVGLICGHPSMCTCYCGKARQDYLPNAQLCCGHKPFVSQCCCLRYQGWLK